MTGPGPSTKKHTNVDDYEDMPPPAPDGGWGWVVVFGSFMVHVVNDGITYSFGVFVNEFLEYFDESKGKTAWIVSILVGVTLCSGPISSAMVNRWGCRLVSIIGSIVASIGLITSVWAPNVITLYFTVGFVTGLGFGLIYLPAIVCVTIYFEKRRSLATGIAVCGSGFGTVIFAPMTDILIKHYTWRGAMLMLSSVVLECLVFATLFRPIEKLTLLPKKGQVLQERSSQVSTPDVVDDKTIAFSMPRGKVEHDSGSLKSQSGRGNKPHAMFTHSDHSVISGISRASIKSRGSLNRPDAFYQKSIQTVAHSSKKSSGEDDTSYTLPSYSAKKRFIDPDEKEKKICGCIPWGPEVRDFLKEMLDVSIFRDPLFMVFLASNFLTSTGCNIPFVFAVPRAISLDIHSDKASYLLSIIGVANTIGRIFLGYLADKSWFNRLYIYIACLLLCGVGIAATSFLTNFYLIATALSVFGFTFGAYTGLTSVILVDLLGLEKLTNAFGMVLLFQGVASLIGPPIAGFLVDATGTYGPAFYLSASSVALSGAILIAVRPIQKRLEAKAQKELKRQST